MKNSWGVFGVLALSVLAGCSSPGQLYKPAALPVASSSELALERVWKRAESDDELNKVYTRLQAIIVGNVIYNINAGGELSALMLDSGKTLWVRQLNEHVSAGLSYSGEYLLVGTPEGGVLALSLKDGEQLWRSQVSTEIIVPPVAKSGYVIVRSVDGVVAALNAESGLEIWRVILSAPALTLRGHSSPVIIDDKVLIGGANGKLLALSLASGEVVWESVIATPKGRTDLERLVDVDSSPIVQDGVIYSAAYQGKVVALAVGDGRLLWSRDIGSSSDMVIDETNLYFVDDSSHVWALDRRSGATLWRQDGLSYRQLNGLLIMGSTLLLGDYEGIMHCLSLEDGRSLTHRQVDDRSVVVAPAYQNGIAYVRSRSGKLYALKAVPRSSP